MTQTVARSQQILRFSRPPLRPRSQYRSYANSIKPGVMNSVPKLREPPTKSMRVLIKEAAEADQIPNDMGLTPDTIVMPAWSKRPSLFSSPGDRYKLEWRRLKQRVLDFGGLLYYKFGIAKKSNRPKLALRNTGRIATALHIQMYTAFADGDVNSLTKICTDGLLSNLRSRIATRKPTERFRWTLHAQLGRPKVMSNRALALPLGEGGALRQAVIRIRSRQSLETLKADGQAVEGTVEPKDVTEYMVVQRMMWKGKEEPWMVWGTVEENDWKEVVSRI
ncbi:MAG: hypothetical protein MMC33_009163 [Icmadophila ericetorum]|nr:hypothetical protein [Icmadophila ericetorum]